MAHLRNIRIVDDLAFIELTQGKWTVIDAGLLDVPLVHTWPDGESVRMRVVDRSWFCVPGSTYTFYANAKHKQKTRHRAIYLHRLVAETPADLEVDHWDWCGLNNTTANLRSTIRRENNLNQRVRRDNASGFRGVSWCQRSRKWAASIAIGGRRRFAGYHTAPEAAAIARDKLAIELHGDSPSLQLNFPELFGRSSQ